MRIFAVIFLTCFLHVSNCIDDRKREISPSAKIYNPFAIGDYSQILENVSIGSNSQIGVFSIMKKNVKIGSWSFIDNCCIFNDSVIIGDAVNIGSFTTIGSNSQVLDGVLVHPGVKIGSNAIVHRYANISNEVIIESGTIINELAYIGPYTIVQKNAFVGSSIVGFNVTVAENVVIQDVVSIPPLTQLEKYDLVIQTPVSAFFYLSCLPYENVPEIFIENMKNGDSATILRRFNYDLRQLLKIQADQLASHCEQISPEHFVELTLIKSLYLMHYHGIEEFKKNRNSIHRKITFDEEAEIIDFYKDERRSKLMKETHFISPTYKHILEPDVRGSLIALLAMEQDAKRAHRVPGDTFCSMIYDLQFGKRKIKWGINKF